MTIARLLKLKMGSFSKRIALKIKSTDFSSCSATVVGYGHMGKHYVKTLQALGVPQIRVCSRSAEPLRELKDSATVQTFSGGFQQFQAKPFSNELAIIAAPTADLIPAANHLRELGFRKFLIEKPISLWSSALTKFYETFVTKDLDVACAYNRVAYPSLLEAEHLAKEEGGITSCTYTFTEFTSRIGPRDYPEEELRRWGIANSLHVMSMAHRLIGMPTTWKGFQSGLSIEWHPSGGIFVGAGFSQKNIPFSYHADWSSTGRWSVEIHTRVASYRFCPLEKLFRKTSFNGDWQEVPIQSFAPDVKTGFAEQTAAILNENIRKEIPLLSLQETGALLQYGEAIFGYE